MIGMSSLSAPLARLATWRETWRKTPAYLAGLLGLFSLTGAALLSIGQTLTGEAIALRQKEDLMASLGLVIPARLHDNDLIADSYELKGADGNRFVYPARRKGRTLGVAYEVIGQGYGGSIVILMGIADNGSLLGVRVLRHAETPGLGDKIDADKGHWINSFDGQSFNSLPKEQWTVKKDGGYFDQFSGATITPRAVVKAVKEGLEFFDAHKAQLIANAPSGTS